MRSNSADVEGNAAELAHALAVAHYAKWIGRQVTGSADTEERCSRKMGVAKILATSSRQPKDDSWS